jgi:hypothetical protein
VDLPGVLVVVVVVLLMLLMPVLPQVLLPPVLPQVLVLPVQFLLCHDCLGEGRGGGRGGRSCCYR